MGRTRGGLFWAPHSLWPQPAGPCPVLSCLPRALPRWLNGQVHPLPIGQYSGSLALRPSQKPAAQSHERHWAWDPLLLRLLPGATLSLWGLGAEPLQRCLLLLGAFFPRVPASLCPHQPPELRGYPRTNASSPACWPSALPPLFSSDKIAPIPSSALQAHVSPWGSTPTQRPPLPVLPAPQAHPLCGWVASLFQAPGAYSGPLPLPPPWASSRGKGDSMFEAFLPSLPGTRNWPPPSLGPHLATPWALSSLHYREDCLPSVRSKGGRVPSRLSPGSQISVAEV